MDYMMITCSKKAFRAFNYLKESHEILFPCLFFFSGSSWTERKPEEIDSPSQSRHESARFNVLNGKIRVCNKSRKMKLLIRIKQKEFFLFSSAQQLSERIPFSQTRKSIWKSTYCFLHVYIDFFYVCYKLSFKSIRFSIKHFYLGKNKRFLPKAMNFCFPKLIIQS